jgi:ribosomal protein S6--L-glutamate ligase
MHIGILSARSSKYHPNRRLIEAAFQLGHNVSIIHPKICLSEIGLGGFGVEMANQGGQPDVLLPRIGSTINEYAITLVRQFELMGLPVVNGFQSILLARNKCLGLQSLALHGIPVPDSCFVSNPINLKRAVESLGGYPVVAKTINSRQGKGVILVESLQTLVFIGENLPIQRQGLLIQEYVAPRERKDIRAFVLGSRVIAAMELQPREGDFRSNVNLTGGGRPVKLNRDLSGLAVKATKALGLDISGTDIVVKDGAAKVIEVNYSPGFKGLEASTGLDIASQIIQYVTHNFRRSP